MGFTETDVGTVERCRWPTATAPPRPRTGAPPGCRRSPPPSRSHPWGSPRRTRAGERAAGRPPQLRPGRGEVHDLVCHRCPPPSRSHPWGSPRRTAGHRTRRWPTATAPLPAADRCTTWLPPLSATQQEPSVGFTETEIGSTNAPLADRHSSSPAAERCTTCSLPDPPPSRSHPWGSPRRRTGH